VTLCKLTKVLPAGTSVFINPAHVVVVETQNGHTMITVTGAGKNGSEHIAVLETLAKAVEALDLAGLE
jgi:hypothetical protein